MATISLPKEVEQELKIISKKLGISKKDLLLKAVLYYLQALEKKIELQKELDVWEKTSEIDLLEFEKRI